MLLLVLREREVVLVLKGFLPHRHSGGGVVFTLVPGPHYRENKALLEAHRQTRQKNS